MAKGFLGHEDAAAFDRLWARLTEKPSAGILMSGERTPLPTPEQYHLMLDEIGTHAATQQRTLRDYAADVWTGIRETIKRENALYGAPYQGSAIPGESKSYAGHFEDLLAEKAAHLTRLEGRTVTVPDLEQRLRTGNATLMAWLLATPVGAALYQRSLGAPAAEPGA